MEEVIDLDSPTHVVPDAAIPKSVIGEIIKWEPYILKLVAAIKAAIAGGPLKVPDIKIKFLGKHITLMTTLLIEP